LSKRRFLVTGATGFVGRSVLATLDERGELARAALRKAASIRAAESIVVGDLRPQTSWDEALSGVDVVIHLAGLAHLPPGAAKTHTEQFDRINAQATLALARACSHAGVRRLVFVSSIKVNGEQTRGGAFTEANIPAPVDAYARSKWQAEQGLHRIAAETGLEVTVVRPPLVYGPGVKANFLQLMRWVDRGVPLPFAAIDNRRSLIAVDNLTDVLVTCATHRLAAGETFVVSDGDDVSTPVLIERIAAALGRRARLFGCPASVVRLAGAAVGRGASVERLLDSLQVDPRKIGRMLGWQPSVTMDQELAATARWLKSISHGTDT